MIIKDTNTLRKKCSPVKTRREGGEIARKLRAALDRYNRTRKSNAPLGIGLAAPQIGIHKQVCILSVNGVDSALINPVIVRWSENKVPTNEGCLSFPGEYFDTWRYLWVEVETSSWGPRRFGPGVAQDIDELSLLSSFAAQHEIGHLAGLLPHDFTESDYPEPPDWMGWPGRSLRNQTGHNSSRFAVRLKEGNAV